MAQREVVAQFLKELKKNTHLVFKSCDLERKKSSFCIKNDMPKELR